VDGVLLDDCEEVSHVILVVNTPQDQRRNEKSAKVMRKSGHAEEVLSDWSSARPLIQSRSSTAKHRELSVQLVRTKLNRNTCRHTLFPHATPDSATKPP